MYDVIIIGAGPAGLTSAIYLLRANKKVLVLEKEGIGGQIASSPLVENYPGFKSISGSELANNLYEQVINLGGDIELEEVLEINDKVVTEDNTYDAKAIIVATGAKYRLLGLEKEVDFIGNGISFCVACDGAFYKDKTVAVIGGGNSAIINAITLCDICKKVIVVQNLDKLTAEKALIDKLISKSNVKMMYNSCVTKLNGDDELESIEVNNKVINLDGMFISIGQVPETSLVKELIDINEYNYINSSDCTTKLDNIFVAGDCRNKLYKQLTTAVSDGTLAALEAINYLDEV